MEDREAWIAGEAREMADKLGIKLPKIVFRDESLLGFPVPMRVVVTDFVGGLNTRTLDVPELRISPTTLAQEDPATLRYRLATALIGGNPDAQRALQKSMQLPGLLGAGLCLGLAYAAYWLTKSRAIGVATCFVAACVFSLVWTRRLMKSTLENPLKAIELTGEFDAAVALMRTGLEKEPRGPAFFRAWARRHAQARMDYVESEARRRGLAPVSNLDV